MHKYAKSMKLRELVWEELCLAGEGAKWADGKVIGAGNSKQQTDTLWGERERKSQQQKLSESKKERVHMYG